MDMGALPARVEANTAKLGELSDEVSRIASTLARLTMQPDLASILHNEKRANDGGNTDIPIEAVENAIQVRRLRHEFFKDELFADPAWDMLLHVYQAEIAQHRVTISTLRSASGVPSTTALRWIKTMTDADLFRRYADRQDARRTFVELSPMASAAMRGYFKKLGKLLSTSG